MKLTKNDFIEDLYAWSKAYFSHIFTLNYSKNTISLYKRIIFEFIEYSLEFQDEMNIKDIKTAYIIAFLQFLDEKAAKNTKKLKNGFNLSKSSKSAYIKAIRAFFAFISENNEENHTFDFAFKKIKLDNTKSEEKLIYLNENEIMNLSAYIERQKTKKNDFLSYRNALLVKLLLHAGLRISEVLNIKLQDLSEEEDIIRIKILAKGAKEQFAYIDKEKIINELHFFKRILKDDDLLIQTNKGTPLNRSNAFLIINRIYAKVGISKRGLHLLRHTLAMRLTQKGVSTLVIKKILRHSNIATTTIYAKATNDMVKEVLISI